MRDVLILLVVLGVAAVLFVAAVVATQEGDVLADAPPDRPDVDLPAGHLVAEDLRSVRFGMVFRGYRMSEVDEVLDRLGGELAARDERIADLEQALVEVVEPAVQEAEARQAAPPATEPDVVEPALPPSLAQGARGGEAPPPPAPASTATPAEAPAPGALEDDVPVPQSLTATEDAFAPDPAMSDEEELTPLPDEWVAATSGAPAPSEPSPVVEASTDPLDPAWQPSAVERTLDLAASYRLTMPGGGTPVAVPVPESHETSEDAGPEEPRTAVPEDDLGFPEVEPAGPATGWAPEAREDTGDDERERRPPPGL